MAQNNSEELDQVVRSLDENRRRPLTEAQKDELFVRESFLRRTRNVDMLKQKEQYKIEKYISKHPHSMYVDMEDEDNSNFKLESGVNVRDWGNQSAYYEYDASKANVVELEALFAENQG